MRVILRKLLGLYRRTGFTLLEVLIATTIISVAGVAMITTVAAFLKISGIAQDTVRAQNLANEKMEQLKNMPYADLATKLGPIYPPGDIEDSSNEISGGHTYVVNIYISFVDDPFDGNALGTITGKPVDFYPFDYKKVTIEVEDTGNSRVLVKISTNIAANAAETSDSTGILFLKVLDSQGGGVPNANVRLTNNGLAPPLDIRTITDLNGLLQIPLLPEDTANGYHLEVSLPGYSSDQTYPDNIAGYDPVQPDFNILAQEVTSVTLAIDLNSSLKITVEDETGSLIPNLDIGVIGDKVTYIDSTGANPDIHKYSNTFTTNSNGLVEVASLEWDSYSLNVPNGYFVISTSPYQSVSVLAGSATTVSLRVTTDSTWPRIEQVTPIEGVNNISVFVEVVGFNLSVGSGMELKKSGQPAITATSVVSSDNNTRLTGNFDLSGVATGVWDLVVTLPNGKTTSQSGGFTITLP